MPEPTPTASSSGFVSTCWTQVLASHGDSTQAQVALKDLCDDYYEPVVAFIRHSGNHADEARDLAHAFFAHVLSGHAFEGADRNRGRFRSYLLGAVKHFLAQDWAKQNRLKRGGKAEHVPIEDSDPSSEQGMSPEDHFDRQWALTILNRALSHLEVESREDDQQSLFEEVRPWLLGDAAHGSQSELAERLGMNSNTLKSHILRLRKRFRDLVKEEVARTLGDPGLVEEEMQSLLAVLRKN